jgi:Zn-dependent M16 (insulinase) family peptidase
MTTLEGPFGKEIRGRGLAYDFSLWASWEKGLLYFELNKATHVAEAFAAAQVLAILLSRCLLLIHSYLCLFYRILSKN